MSLKTALYISVNVLGIVSFVVFISWLGNSILYYIDDARISLRQGIDQIKPDNTLILGDSYPSYSLRNTILESSNIYNYSYPGENCFCSFIKLKYLVNNNKKPKLVIVNWDEHQFNQRRNNVTPLLPYQAVFDLGEINDVSISKVNLAKIIIGSLIPVSVPKNRALIQNWLSTYFTGKPLRQSKSFYYNSRNELVQGDKKWVDLDANQRILLAEARYEINMGGEFSSDVLSCYKEISSFCKKEGISIIAVKFPVSKEYQAIQNEESKKVLGYHEKIKEASIRIDTVLDYSRIFNNSQYFFLNSDHLNGQGAKKFSNIFIKDLILAN